MQTKLQALHYYGGPIDGSAGAGVRSAVMAFQKVQGLSADGAVGPATLAALDAPKDAGFPTVGPDDRVEVDLSRQVLAVYRGGSLERIMPVSSGNGANYSSGGATATALTPAGYFKIERRIIGERHAALGVLYDPNYFYRGWAIHGSNSVPAYPASHGCVRVTRPDAKYLLGVTGVGTTVHLYGGSYVFNAGSSAPGTDDPGGDTGSAASPEPAPAPTTASPAPTTQSSSPKPSPTFTYTPEPDPTSASPSPKSASATASPATAKQPSASASASPKA